MRKFRLLAVLAVALFAGGPGGRSSPAQMGIARAVAKTPGVPPTPCYAGAIRFNSANNSLYLCGPNSTWSQVGAAAGTVTGTGTANQFAIFTSSTAIGNSILTQGTNLIEQKNSTNAQTFRVYGTTANTGEVAQIVALSSANATRFGSKQLASGATARPTEWGYEQSDGTFLGWGVSTGGNLNPVGSNPAAEIGNTTPPKSLYLGSVGNATGFLKLTGTTAGTLTLTVPASLTTHTLTLPSAQGATSSVLTNNGSGTLSWTVPAPGYPGIALTAPVDGDFAWVNQGAASVDTTNGGIFLLAPASTTDQLRIRKKAAPATPWTLTIAFQPFAFDANFLVCGIILRESSTSKLISLDYGYSSTTMIEVEKFTNETTFSSQTAVKNIGAWESINPSLLVYLRVTDNGTNLIYGYGIDGVHFRTLLTESRTAHMAGGPNEIGFGCNASNATIDTGMWLWSWKVE
jgi:hypothetical protein